MKRIISMLLCSILLIASCKKSEPVSGIKTLQSKSIITLNDYRISRLVKSEVLKNYLATNGYSLAKDAVLSSRRGGSTIGIRLQKTSRSDASMTFLTVFEEQDGKLFTPYIISEKQYSENKVGYEISSLLTPDNIEKEFKYYSVGGDIVPDIRDCGNNRNYIDCIWDCFNWLGNQGSVWGIGCIIFAPSCMSGAAIACLAIIDNNNGTPLDYSAMQSILTQKVVDGYISQYIAENDIFIVK